MFIENFFLVFGCIFLSLGFILWTTGDFVESKYLGSKYAKRMVLVGIISIAIMIALLKLS